MLSSGWGGRREEHNRDCNTEQVEEILH